MLMAATAAMTSASNPMISLVRRDMRSEKSRTPTRIRAARLPVPCTVMAERA